MADNKYNTKDTPMVYIMRYFEAVLVNFELIFIFDTNRMMNLRL